MSKLAPKAFLTAPVWSWGPKYAQIARDVLAGTYKSESYWGGWKDGIVGLALIIFCAAWVRRVVRSSITAASAPARRSFA